MLSRTIDTRFEVELPGDWPPCPRCASRVRVARARLDTRTIDLYCGGSALHALRWTAADGTSTENAPDDFWPGGDFAGLIPAYYLGPRPTDRLQPFTMSDRRRDWINNEQSACANCGVPPVNNWSDHGAIVDWLCLTGGTEYRALAAIVETQPQLQRTTWYNTLLHDHYDVLAQINFRVQDSILQADQSIPQNVLVALWPNWSADMRRIAVNTLAFGFCRRCIDTTGEHIPLQGELLRRHYVLNHDGSIAAARSDQTTWTPLVRVVQSIDDYRLTQPGFGAVP